MKFTGHVGPLQKSVVEATAVLSALQKQLPTLDPNSPRYKFALCFTKAREKFKTEVEELYIKVAGKESPPLPGK